MDRVDPLQRMPVAPEFEVLAIHPVNLLGRKCMDDRDPVGLEPIRDVLQCKIEIALGQMFNNVGQQDAVELAPRIQTFIRSRAERNSAHNLFIAKQRTESIARELDGSGGKITTTHIFSPRLYEVLQKIASPASDVEYCGFVRCVGKLDEMFKKTIVFFLLQILARPHLLEILVIVDPRIHRPTVYHIIKD